MVNFGLNSASILGIFLAVAGAGLYFLRSLRPELARDHDIFFAAVGLLCGGILLWHGWRLDPILQFSQLLLAGSTIFFAAESIRLRGIATEQARRNTPIVDDERPPASRVRVYQEARLDEIEPDEEEERYDNRRLRGYEDPRTVRRNAAVREETSRSRSGYERSGSRETIRKRQSRPSTSSLRQGYDDYWNEEQDNLEQRPSPYYDPRPRQDSPPPATGSRRTPKRRPRPSDGGSGAKDSDYVDYQPLDKSEKSNSDWERESGEENRDLNRDRPTNRDNPVNFDY